MKGLNVSGETVRKIVKNGCGLAAFILTLVLPNLSAKDVRDLVRYSGNIKYDAVVGAVMDCNMFAADKGRAVALIPKDGDAEIYRAIVQVVNSNMFAHDKLKAIESICEK